MLNCADHFHFSEDDHFILQTIADFSAIAMANAFLYAKTVNVAHTDVLTGALNRIRMDGIVKDWQALDSSDSPEGVTIVMIDMNNFKKVNDNYGHCEGDKILIITSKSIESRLEPHDMFFRTGGDEFVVLSPLATMEMSNAVESRIHEHMTSANVFIEELETGFDFHVLFSYGIVSGPVKEFNEVMNKADAAMFENKKEFKAKYGSFVR